MQSRGITSAAAALALSVGALSAGAAFANPGDAVRDVVDGTTHRAVQTGRAGVGEGERLGHRGLQTGRAVGHTAGHYYRKATGRHRHHHYRQYR